jgi:hypothetical protein
MLIAPAMISLGLVSGVQSQELPSDLTDISDGFEETWIDAKGDFLDVPEANLTADPTLAQIDQYLHDLGGKESLGQLRSVTQLQDLPPTAWAYQAVRSLVERYSCVAGYPDATFRGDRAITRYEAAALVNACLDTVNDLIASSTANLVTQEDLAVLQRLQEEFRTELGILRDRVDALEGRTAELEANQFSTTTKLEAEVLFSLNDTFGEDFVDTIDGSDNTDDNDNAVFGGRVRLNLHTSFTGRDLLKTRLQIGNVSDRSGQLEYADNTADNGGATGSEPVVVLDDLWYRFPVGEKAEVIVGPWGVEVEEMVPTIAWEYGGFANFLEGGWTVYDNVSEEAGLGGNYQVNPYINIAAGYLSGEDADENGPGLGVFVNDWTAFTQLTGTVGRFQGVLTYLHEYDKDSDSFFDGVGTLRSQDPFSGNAGTLDEVGIGINYQFSPRFIFSAFGSYAWLNDQTNGDNANAYSWALGLIFPDLFREGNQGGIAFGTNPTIVRNDNGATGEDDHMPLIVDAFYDFRISESIKITPGGFVILNGDGNDDTGPVGVAAVKTTFEF